jgi:purine-nucleoside phosphorylase
MKSVLLIGVLLTASVNANAATAFLTSCQTGTSVTGMFIYTGTYQYLGKYFTQSFSTYCPQTVEIY